MGQNDTLYSEAQFIFMRKLIGLCWGRDHYHCMEKGILVEKNNFAISHNFTDSHFLRQNSQRFSVLSVIVAQIFCVLSHVLIPSLCDFKNVERHEEVFPFYLLRYSIHIITFIWKKYSDPSNLYTQ